MATTQTVDRRTFLKVGATAGGGLMLGGYLSDLIDGDSSAALAAGLFEPNVWLRIAPDDTVTIMLSQLEMGQGVMTSMPMLVAEDLDADWKTIRTEWTPADSKYGNPNFGGAQLTAGSNSVRGMWKILRTAGGTARAMLVTAAASTWGVPENTCSTEKSDCEQYGKCSIRDPLWQIRERIVAALGTVTIAEMASEQVAGTTPVAVVKR